MRQELFQCNEAGGCVVWVGHVDLEGEGDSIAADDRRDMLLLVVDVIEDLREHGAKEGLESGLPLVMLLEV